MTVKRPLTLSRRTVLAGMGGLSLVSVSSAGAQPSQTSGKKLIVVILRGAMDGLAAVPRLENGQLKQYRPDLIADGLLKLTDGFSLHPSLSHLHSLFVSGDAAAIHAVSGPYRDRSHFLAQDLLESGNVDAISNEGWLNRALQHAPMPLSAVSIGPVTPLILRGAQPATTWSPPTLPEASDDTIARLMNLYSEDTLLGPALENAVTLDEVAGGMKERARGRGSDATALEAAGSLLSAPGGPDIAVVSLGNWDTHAQQMGLLNRRLKQLDEGLAALQIALGETWKDTAVAVVTEFGRTVRQNGTRGTDHGTGGAAFVLGGAVRGGRMLGDWPGLDKSKLYENRDLYPANDMRGLFKGLLAEQFHISGKTLANDIFAESAGVRDISTT